MATPVVLLLVALVLTAGQVGLAHVRSQQLAGLAARIAATQPDDAVRRALADHVAADGQVLLDPPSPVRRAGDLVTATVRRDVPVLLLPGAAIPVAASATALTDLPAP